MFHNKRYEMMQLIQLHSCFHGNNDAADSTAFFFFPRAANRPRGRRTRTANRPRGRRPDAPTSRRPDAPTPDAPTPRRVGYHMSWLPYLIARAVAVKEFSNNDPSDS